jgi:chromatin remodeling complex protein RSC6
MVKKTKKPTKKTSSSSSSKVKAPVSGPPAAPAKEAVPAKEAAPVQAAKPDTDALSDSLSDAFSDLLGQLASLRTQLTAVTTQARQLSKRSEREIKAALKQSRRRPRKAGTRSPSGFVKPTLISKELASFLGKEHGTEMARTDVTREINSYIRAHKLQDPKNGRRILADIKLRKLLKLKKDDELTYFNLQRYMSPHFAKSGKSAAPATSSA